MKERSHSKAVVSPQKVWVKKHTRTWGIKATAAVLLLVFITILLRGNWPIAFLVVSAGMGLWGFLDVRHHRRARAAILHEVEAMDDGQLLAYAADLLRTQGYTVHKANPSLDSRTDLLLTRGKTHLLCRLQRQSGWVSRNAIAGALAATHAHGCTRAMIVTNQAFTRSARSLARQNDCVLIDGDALASLVLQHRQGHRVLVFHREEAARIRRRK
jgi:HJR/Mrr/RecB family endonuclease